MPNYFYEDTELVPVPAELRTALVPAEDRMFVVGLADNQAFVLRTYNTANTNNRMRGLSLLGLGPFAFQSDAFQVGAFQ